MIRKYLFAMRKVATHGIKDPFHFQKFYSISQKNMFKYLKIKVKILLICLI